MALASLIPVGIHEVRVDSRADMTAMVGRNAWRDMKVRDWLRGYSPNRPNGSESLWYFHNGSPVFIRNTTTSRSSPGTPPGKPTNVGNPFNNNKYGADAFALDPLVMSHPSQTSAGDSAATGDQRRGYFPLKLQNDPTGIDAQPYYRMARLTLRASAVDSFVLRRGLREYEYAKRLFMPENELILAEPDKNTEAPRRAYSNGADGAPGQAGVDDDADGVTDEQDGSEGGYWDDIPLSRGDYSWMMTVIPSITDFGATTTVAVVVFYQRTPIVPAFNFSARAGKAPIERCVNVEPISMSGDFRLYWTAGEGDPDIPNIHAGDWIMFFGRLVVHEPGTPPPAPQPGPKIVQWYQVLAVDDGPQYDSTSGVWERAVTLAGPNWDSSGVLSAPFAVVLHRAVGVYQKTVQLK